MLLTRDRDLVVHLRPERALLLAPVDALAQLREVVQGCGLTPPFALFSRCLLCNAPLRAAEPAEVQAGVPERSRALPGPFLRCPDCGRLYWPGTHVQHMRACLAAALPGAIPAQSPPAPDAGGRGCSSPPFQR